MLRSRRDIVWIPTFALLVAFAVPWPLWGVDRVVAGLPVWIWWHVAWLGLCAVLFSRFARGGAWERGMGLRPETEGGDGGGDGGGEGGEGTGAPAAGGDRP